MLFLSCMRRVRADVWQTMQGERTATGRIYTRVWRVYRRAYSMYKYAYAANFCGAQTCERATLRCVALRDSLFDAYHVISAAVARTPVSFYFLFIFTPNIVPLTA